MPRHHFCIDLKGLFCIFFNRLPKDLLRNTQYSCSDGTDYRSYTITPPLPGVGNVLYHGQFVGKARAKRNGSIRVHFDAAFSISENAGPVNRTAQLGTFGIGA